MTVLHPTRTEAALVPRYVTRFRCIGSRCEDNCCTNWSVAIDEPSYREYKQCSSPKLRNRLQNSIKPRQEGATTAAFAEIVLDSKTSQCPFMEQGLCAIHHELGEDKLSDTCATYPRITRDWRGHLEQALQLSCPEAARLALGAADAFDFVQSEATVRPARVFFHNEHPGIPLALMDDMRLFCLRLMGYDGLKIWQRLAAIGVLCDAVTRSVTGQSEAGAEAAFRGIVARVESGVLFETFAGIEADHQSQATAFVINFLNRVSKRESTRQIRLWERISNGLGIDIEKRTVAVDDLTRNYRSGLARMDEALKACPHVLKHYLLNEMYGHLFPFGAPTPYHHFVNLASRFGMLRLMLAAQCNTEGALPGEAEIIETVQVFCKVMQHNKQFVNQVNSVHEIFSWGNLENVFRFLPA